MHQFKPRFDFLLDVLRPQQRTITVLDGHSSGRVVTRQGGRGLASSNTPIDLLAFPSANQSVHFQLNIGDAVPELGMGERYRQTENSIH
jgi:hypothetical protein